MKQQLHKKITGFTLIEVLLLMVIVSMVIVAGMSAVQQRTEQTKIDRTTVQMQQILNAALSYYVINGTWPDKVGQSWPGSGIGCLQGNGTPPAPNVPCNHSLIPATLTNAFGTYNNAAFGTYLDASLSNVGYYLVIAPINAGSRTMVVANAIANRLPNAWVTDSLADNFFPCTSTDTTCFVFSKIYVPGQNLSNATGVNYAGLYHHGACVPAPACPYDPSGHQLTPQILVMPVSVTGNYAPGQPTPISSFTAFATGNAPLDNMPPACDSGNSNNPTYATSTGADCQDSNHSNGPILYQYWRVCLKIVTERGDVAASNSTTWGDTVTVLAVTRCALANEAGGSTLSVFSN